MRIGINEVLISNRASGAQKREMNVLPELLLQIEDGGGTSCVYFSRNLNTELSRLMTGQAKGVTEVRTPLSSLPTYQRILKGHFYWKNQVSRDRLDLFHTSYYPLPRLPVPTVMTINDVRFLRLPETYKRPRYLFLRLTVPPSLRRATRIIAISADTKNDLVGLVGIPEDRIDIIPLAIPPAFSRVSDGTQLEKIKKIYHLPDRYILFVGHLEPRKNLPRLIQAYSSLRDRFDVGLVIVGKGVWPAKSLLNQGHNRKLSEGIRFTGYVEDEHLPGLYSLASLLAFPSLHEGFGLPVLEGMACGIPVVTSNTSALPEVAGDAAVLVNPSDVESIAAGLARVLNDMGLREGLIAKGLQRVKHFQPKNIAAQTIESYKKALANPRQKPGR